MICPQCRVSVPSGAWIKIDIISDSIYEYSIKHFYCSECQQYSIKFIGIPQRLVPYRVGHEIRIKDNPLIDEFLLPKTSFRNPIAKDVEEIYRRDYDEAVKLLSISPMASAAFSRRLLQHYIEKKHGIKKPDLKQEIKELEKLNKYPSDLIELFGHIRHYGTFAAHAKTDQISGEIIDIEAGEADSLLDILEEMFDYDYERKRRIKERDKKLQDKLQRSKSKKKDDP